MTEYDPRNHVFSYGGIVPKGRREQNALSEFCKRMQRAHRAKYTVVSVDCALVAGLIVKSKGETVDGVIQTPRGPVAIELLAYAPLDDRGDVMARDFQLRKRVKRDMFDQLDLARCALSLGYRERLRCGRDQGRVRTVPPFARFDAIVEEVRRAVSLAPPLPKNRFISIRFIPADRVRRLGIRNKDLYLDANEFPQCAQYLDRIRLQGLPPAMPPDVGSELSCGMIGLDESWMRGNLHRKARTSRGLSSIRANGLPLWLIIHSDGHATNQTIAEPNRRRAVAMSRRILDEVEHAFGRAYWADQTGFIDVTWVGRLF